MNATQVQLLKLIDNGHKGLHVVTHGFRTNRKNGSFGGRMWAAAIALRDAGIIEFVSVSSYQDCRQTYTDNWTEIVCRRVAQMTAISR